MGLQQDFAVMRDYAALWHCFKKMSLLLSLQVLLGHQC